MPPSRRQNGAASSSSSSSKATPISLAFDAKLRSSLAHLPPSVYSALVARDIAPQNIVLQVTRRTPSPATSSEDEDDDEQHDGKDAPRHTVFVGWSGQSSNIESTLVLSSSMANLFHPTAQSSSSSSSSSAYTLTLLRSPPLPTATRVDLTPLTPDDWELLSQNAGAVEDDMLSQVRSVCTGGRVCIFVGRGASQECWFTVDATEPQTASSSQHRRQQAAAAAAAHPRAVRLTTDTEIVIAPRTRQSQAAAAAAQAHDISSSKGASQQQQLNGALAARARVKNRIYKVLPDSLRPTFSDTHAQLPDLGGDASIVVLADHEANEDDGEADEEEQEETHSDWSLLAQAYGSGEKQSWGRVTLTVQPCPSAPATRPMDAASTSSTTDSPPSAEASARSPPPKRPTTTAYIVKGAPSLGDGRAWPKRWVWLNSAAREKLGGVGPGETVCFSAPPPSSVSPPPTGSEQQQLVSATLPPAPEMPGCAALLEAVESHIINATTSSASSSSSSNMLLHGPSGVGKTLLLHTLAKRLRPHLTTTLYVDCTPLSELRLSQLKTTFREWRNALDWYAQSGGAILMLDNLDKVLIAEVENVDPSRARALAECFVQNLCDSPAGARQEDEASSSSSLVLATANSSTSLHKLLVEKHVWAESMSMKPPGKQERSEVLQHLVAEKAKSSTTMPGKEGGEREKEQGAPATGIEADPSLNYVLLAAQTEGYLPADLVDFVDRAIYRAVVRVGGEQEATKQEGGKSSPQQPLRLNLADFTSAQENFTPISLRSLSLSSSGTTSWSSIGGLHATRRVLRETLEFPSRYAQIFASCPLRLRSGLLLYGYPGCGKTMLASAVAKECGANFVSVKGPEILNKYIGASEKSVRDLFERASAAKPCVLFFDEFDSIAPKRGHDSTGVTDRVVNQLLTQMDGAEGLSGVYVLAATSRPDLIDSALLRPGRLDKSLLCDLPDEDDRVDILVAVAREGKIEIEDEGEGGWARQWAKKTPGFSGADLQALVYNAHLEVVHEGIEATAAANGGNDGGEDDGEAGGPLEFAEVVGSSSSSGDDASTSTSTRRSGAEEQALRRRLELALTNSRAQQHQRPGRRAAPAVNGEAAASEFASNTVAARGHRLVTSAHLSRSLAGLRPSVPEAERVRLARIYREFAGGKERGEEGFASGEGSREVGARESLM